MLQATGGGGGGILLLSVPIILYITTEDWCVCVCVYEDATLLMKIEPLRYNDVTAGCDVK